MRSGLTENGKTDRVNRTFYPITISPVVIVGQKWRYSPQVTRNDESGRKSRRICCDLSRLTGRDPGASPKMTHNVSVRLAAPATARGAIGRTGTSGLRGISIASTVPSRARPVTAARCRDDPRPGDGASSLPSPCCASCGRSRALGARRPAPLGSGRSPSGHGPRRRSRRRVRVRSRRTGPKTRPSRA